MKQWVHKLFLRRRTLCILLNDPYGLTPSMKTWPTEPCDPETSLRFHGDVAGFGSLRRPDLHAVRRQLWRWENYITHISAVIAYGNGNPLGSMGLNEEADMWELVAAAWTGLSLGWRRFCGLFWCNQEWESIWKKGFIFLVSFSFQIFGSQGFRVAETAAQNMHAWHFCSMPPVNPHKHATTGAVLQFGTWGCDTG